MTAALPDLDLAQLIADTEGEIVRLVQDRDPSTHGLYEMVRYHLALDGSGASGGKRMRPLLGLLAYASIAGDHRRALPGAAAVELGHNFSLVHDDIEDGDRERRHRPTLWSVHGVPQAINAGDTLFSLSRIALHRLTDLGFSDAKVLRLMRLYDETCLALCEGQYIDIATSESDELMTVDALLRHDRAQDRGAHRRVDRGRRAARDRRRRGHRPLPRLRLGARASPSSSTTTCSASGAPSSRPARSRPTSPIARRRCRSSTPRPRPDRTIGARLLELYAPRRADGDEVAEFIAILERTGARDYTRDQARRYRDEALRELDAAGVVRPDVRARLEDIIVWVIAA